MGTDSDLMGIIGREEMEKIIKSKIDSIVDVYPDNPDAFALAQKMNVELSQRPGIAPEEASKVYDALTFMRRGSPMCKHKCTSRNDQFDYRMFELSEDSQTILYTSRKSVSYDRIPIKSIKYLHLKQQSKGFRRDPRPRMKHLSFTLVYETQNGMEELDLICSRQTDYTVWTTALPLLIKTIKSGGDLKDLMVSVSINPEKESCRQLMSLPQITLGEKIGSAMSGMITRIPAGKPLIKTRREKVAERLECVKELRNEIVELARNPKIRRDPYFEIVEEKYRFIRERYNSALEAQQVRDFVWLHEEIVQALAEVQALALKLRILKKTALREERIQRSKTPSSAAWDSESL